MLGRSSGNHDWLVVRLARFPSKRIARNASDCVWMETGLYLEPSCAEAELEKYSPESTESTRQRLYCRVQFSSSVTDKSTIAPVAFDLLLTPASLYLVEGLAWWDWPFIWCTNQLLSFSVLTLLVGSSDL